MAKPCIPLQVYKHKQKQEIRLIYRDGLTRTRHQKSFAIQSDHIEKAWQKAARALLYIKATGYEPPHFGCRVNGCSLVDDVSEESITLPSMHRKDIFFIKFIHTSAFGTCAQGTPVAFVPYNVALVVGMIIPPDQVLMPDCPSTTTIEYLERMHAAMRARSKKTKNYGRRELNSRSSAC